MMSKEKIIKFLFICVLVLFFGLLFAQSSGYYKIKTTRVKELTEEQIKAFEKDISDGKDVDIKDYLEYDNIDYSNKLSSGIYKVSLKLEKVVDSTIKYIFNSAEKLVVD